MKPFTSADDFISNVQPFLDKVRMERESVLAGSGLVLAFRIVDLGVTLVMDASEPSSVAMFDVSFLRSTADVAATCTYALDSTTFDRVCSGVMPALLALTVGQIRIVGGNHVAAVGRTTRAIQRIIPAYRRWRRRITEVHNHAPLREAVAR